MGTSMHYFNWFKNLSKTYNILFEGAYIIDVGAQNLVGGTLEDFKEFLAYYNQPLKADPISLEKVASEMANSACVKPGVRTLYLAELLLKAGFKYQAFDIYDSGFNCSILDLNKESTPQQYNGVGDFVLNFGTTEHIFNQLNSFKVIHELTKRGGFIFHQVPFSGYLDHGFFNYNPKFFEMLGHSNDYDIIYLGYHNPQGMASLSDLIHYNEQDQESLEKWHKLQSPNGVINVLYRKKHDNPFKIDLDISTTAETVDETITQHYANPQSSQKDDSGVENNASVVQLSKISQESSIQLKQNSSSINNQKDVKNLISNIPILKKFFQPWRSPNNHAVQGYLNQATTLVQQHKISEAIASYEIAISLKPDLAQAYLDLGNLLVQQGKTQKSLENYHKAIAINPDWAAAYFYRGNALNADGQYQAAIEDYQKALTLQPNWYDLQVQLSKTLETLKQEQYNTQQQEQKNQQEQEQQHKQKQEEEFAVATYQQGQQLMQQGQWKAAASKFEQAIVKCPNLATAHLGLGSALAKQNKLAQAGKSYAKALQINHALSTPEIAAILNRNQFIENIGQLSEFEIYRALIASIDYIAGAEIEGDIFEFGTMFGNTASIMSATLARYETNPYVAKRFSEINLHLFDSFQGLPLSNAPEDSDSPHVQSGTWGPGACTGSNKQEVLERCQQFLPETRIFIYEGWFKETLNLIPLDTKIALLHVDCDLYQSAMEVLDTCFEKGFIQKGAVIVFDDFNCNQASPEFGERKAWERIVQKYEITYSDWGGYGWAGWKFIVHAYKIPHI